MLDGDVDAVERLRSVGEHDVLDAGRTPRARARARARRHRSPVRRASGRSRRSRSASSRRVAARPRCQHRRWSAAGAERVRDAATDRRHDVARPGRAARRRARSPPASPRRSARRAATRAPPPCRRTRSGRLRAFKIRGERREAAGEAAEAVVADRLAGATTRGNRRRGRAGSSRPPRSRRRSSPRARRCARSRRASRGTRRRSRCRPRRARVRRRARGATSAAGRRAAATRARRATPPRPLAASTMRGATMPAAGIGAHRRGELGEQRRLDLGVVVQHEHGRRRRARTPRRGRRSRRRRSRGSPAASIRRTSGAARERRRERVALGRARAVVDDDREAGRVRDSAIERGDRGDGRRRPVPGRDDDRRWRRAPSIRIRPSADAPSRGDSIAGKRRRGAPRARGTPSARIVAQPRALRARRRGARRCSAPAAAPMRGATSGVSRRRRSIAASAAGSPGGHRQDVLVGREDLAQRRRVGGHDGAAGGRGLVHLGRDHHARLRWSMPKMPSATSQAASRAGSSS